MLNLELCMGDEGNRGAVIGEAKPERECCNGVPKPVMGDLTGELLKLGAGEENRDVYGDAPPTLAPISPPEHMRFAEVDAVGGYATRRLKTTRGEGGTVTNTDSLFPCERLLRTPSGRRVWSSMTCDAA
mmetsp:Transcript_26245/g.42948  ORF Transcript_26245/g.42948 Transcript_26245/m.42948 type:complete len:129 (-) Transcript_26245:1026-1412(-)